MESVQNLPARPPRKRDNVMYNEISSTSSDEGTNSTKYTSLYKSPPQNLVRERESAASDNEIDTSRKNLQARSHYKSMGDINDKYSSDNDNQRQSDINCNIESNTTSLDVSLHAGGDAGATGCQGLKVPIVGYEVMEERARFTIYKLKVEDDTRSRSWLVFRRYTDFVRLYQRLKSLRPLPLPAKRWFGDNFQPAFLEERVRGLQIFVNALLRQLPNHPLVREFFCLDDPPQAFTYQPEVQAVYGALEDSISTLKMQLKQKDATIMHLQRRIKELEDNACNCSTKSSDS